MATSPNALPLYQRSSGRPDPKVTSVGEVANRFLDLMMFNSQPLVRHLSGLELDPPGGQGLVCGWVGHPAFYGHGRNLALKLIAANRDVVDRLEQADAGHHRAALRRRIPGRVPASLVARQHHRRADDRLDGADADEDLNNEETKRVVDRTKPVRRKGYIVRIADFGTIAIGEVILKSHQRTVNMLRFSLGSAMHGEMTFLSTTTNGTDMFPP